jgi:predicted phosphodiesterase
MKVAVVTDIHGNIHALEAVLADIEAQSVDEVVIAGDTVNVLPNAKACWDRVMALGCPVLRGNHEYYAYTCGTPDAPLEWQQERFKGLTWLRDQFSDADLEAMRALPMTHTLPDLLVTHASPTSFFDSVAADTPVKRLRELFGGVEEALIVRGHNHKWFEHRWDGHTLITVDSCGLPLTGKAQAPYLLLEKRACWHAQRRRVPYDLEAALATMDEAYLETMGPLGVIFRRELETAQNHLMPFLGLYLGAVDSGALTLSQAVERFLNERA